MNDFTANTINSTLYVIYKSRVTCTVTNWY